MKRQVWGIMLVVVMVGILAGGWGIQTDTFQSKSDPSDVKIIATTDAATSKIVWKFFDQKNSGGIELSNIGGMTAHGSLTGLTTGNDHTQYLYKATTSTVQTMAAPVQFTGAQFRVVNPTTCAVTATTQTYVGNSILFEDGAGVDMLNLYTDSGYGYAQGEIFQVGTTTTLIYADPSTGEMQFYDPVIGDWKTLTDLLSEDGLWETYDSSNYYRLKDVPLLRVTSGGVLQVPNYIEVDWDETGTSGIYWGPYSNAKGLTYATSRFYLTDGLQIVNDSDDSATYAYGLKVGHTHTADVSSAYGAYVSAQCGDNITTAAITNMSGLRVLLDVDTGSSVTNGYSIYASPPTGTVTNSYAGYFGNPTNGSSVNWSIYAAGDAYVGDDLTVADDCEIGGAINAPKTKIVDSSGDIRTSGDLQVNGGEIGIATDTDLMSLAANQLTVNGTIVTAAGGTIFNNGGILELKDANGVILRGTDSTFPFVGVYSSIFRAASAYNNNIQLDAGAEFQFRDIDSSTAVRVAIDSANGNIRTSGDIQVNGGDIGIAADTNLLGLAADTLTVRGKVEVGTAATYLQQSGSAASVNINSLAYGAMSNSGTSYTVTMGTISTAVEIAGGFSSGQVNDVSFGSNHYLQVAEGGKYLVNWNMAVQQPLAGDLLVCGIMIDGSAATAGTSAIFIERANVPFNASGSAILDLADSEQISLYVKDATTGSRNVVVRYGNVTVVRVGE